MKRLLRQVCGWRQEQTGAQCMAARVPSLALPITLVWRSLIMCCLGNHA
jgi:hypothetical protein